MSRLPPLWMRKAYSSHHLYDGGWSKFDGVLLRQTREGARAYVLTQARYLGCHQGSAVDYGGNMWIALTRCFIYTNGSFLSPSIEVSEA